MAYAHCDSSCLSLPSCCISFTGCQEYFTGLEKSNQERWVLFNVFYNLVPKSNPIV